MTPPPFLRPRHAALTFAALASLAVISSASLLAGCGGEAAGPSARVKAETQPRIQAVEIQPEPLKPGVGAADEGLAARVKARLSADPRLHGLPIDVDAQGGRITLWGKVERRVDKTAAGELARRTPGATSVANLIEIRGEPSRR